MYSKISVFIILMVSYLCHSSPQTLRFSGDDMEAGIAKGRERMVLTGNARLLTEDSEITADKMELYRNFTFAVCSGNVHMINEEKQLELTSDKLFYDSSDKILQVQGNAIMIDRQNEIVVKGGFIENWEEDDITIIQIGVRILKEDLICRSEFARYLRLERMLELSGLPVVNLKGDEYRAAKIYVNLDDYTVRLEGGVEGSVQSATREEKEESSQETSSIEEGSDE